MKEPFATIEEIKAAHDILLPGMPDFEDDKLKVIESNVSRDIKACPGSGKTTVLLAKLSILSNRMPSADGKGICVLTHTNVAIDEIKARFGGKADLLFGYPNFCGTIQAFVDRFLTIPWFNSIRTKSLVTVDDDRAVSLIKKEFYKTSWDDQTALNHLFRENSEYKKACEEKRWEDVKRMKADFVTKVYLDVLEGKYYKKYGASPSIASLNPKKPSPTYTFLQNVRACAFREGVLKYDDAYSVGLAYYAMKPEIRESLSKRFKYVFIDEVQDSSQLQLDLLEAVFDSEKTVVQRFGDENQAIYNIDEACAWEPNNPLPLNESKRFGENIAKVLRTICINDNNELQGNNAMASVKPVMLVYTDAQKVLPDFAKLLREKKIGAYTVADIALGERKKDPLNRVNVKAVGFVGKPKEVDGEWLSLHRYFPQFENQTTAKKPFGETVTLNTFLQKNSLQNNPQEYRSHLLDALVTVLERADIKRENGRRYNKTTMLERLEGDTPEVYELLKGKLSEWVLKICKSEFSVDSEVFDSVKSFITVDFASVFGFRANIGVVKTFLKKEDAAYYEAKKEQQSENIYHDRDLDIEVATVHSVKGETHAATLFLETKYYKFESEHFGAQLCGEAYKPRKGDSHVLPALKVAYVAMSRPKYMLAYAIHKERFDLLDKAKLEKIWEIREEK